jgi:hypothetical protein
MTTKKSKSRAGFWITSVGAAILLLIIVVLATASSVYMVMKDDGDFDEETSEGTREFIIAVAEFPGLAKQVLRDLTGTTPNPLLVKRTRSDRTNWQRKFPAPEDDGYLLLSGMDSEVKHSAVKLIRIADGKVMAQWVPDWDLIYSRLSDKKWERKGSTANALPQHPLLLADGDIIFQARFGMIRSSVCSKEPVWLIDHAFHHSIEPALDGASLWAPSIAEGTFKDYNPWLEEHLRNDSIARVSFDGKLLENHSMAQILIDNGLRSKVLGSGGHGFQDDPLHINYINVATSDGKYWQRGDLLISARTPSTIFLYRPSTGKILWHKTGPWLNQHAVRFLDDHRISIFDNNVFSGSPHGARFVHPEDMNRVLIYDFATGEISEPYAALLEPHKPITRTEGFARILPDGGLFLEETNNGRHLRFSKDKLLWSRVNDYDPETREVGIVAWSRYLTAEEAQQPLAAIAAKQCR